MIFDQSSTRTRSSASVAMTELGRHENLEDTGRVLGDLIDIIDVHISSQEAINSIALNSRAPLVSFMSDDDHPT